MKKMICLLSNIRYTLILSVIIYPLVAEIPVIDISEQDPLFGEGGLSSYMSRINPFDRRTPLYAQLEAHITSKNGRLKVLEYEMFISRDVETASVMIQMNEPAGYKNTRVLITAPIEGGFPDISLMMPFFLVPFRIEKLSTPMPFFGMDVTSEDMNSRNTALDTYRVLEIVYADVIPQNDIVGAKNIGNVNESIGSIDSTREIVSLVVEGRPSTKSDYKTMIYYIDTKRMLSMKTEFYDKRDRLVKVLEVLEVGAPDNIVSAIVLKMSDILSGSNTVITYKELVYNIDVSEFITDDYLKTGDTD